MKFRPMLSESLAYDGDTSIYRYNLGLQLLQVPAIFYYYIAPR